MNVHIRRGTIADLHAIQALSQELFEFELAYTDQYNLSWSFASAGKKFFTKRLRRNSRVQMILVAETDGKIVGYAAMWIGNIAERASNPIAEIENLCVASAYRGKGIGTALMGEIHRVVKARGVKRLRVIALSHNEAAVRFYRSHGYGDIDFILEKDVV